MAGITAETAQRHLDAWLEAELALTNAQSYTMQTANGSRTLTKANLSEIRQNIDTWQKRLDEALAREKRRSRNTIFRGVPKDY